MAPTACQPFADSDLVRNNFPSDPGNNVAVLVHSTRSRPSIAAHRIGCGDCASRGRRGDKLMTAAVRRWGRATCYDANMAIVCRSEEHTSELQSLMRISYAVFCLKKKKNTI